MTFFSGALWTPGRQGPRNTFAVTELLFQAVFFFCEAKVLENVTVGDFNAVPLSRFLHRLREMGRSGSGLFSWPGPTARGHFKNSLEF